MPVVLRECFRRVQEEHDKYVRFQEKRAEVAYAFAPSCERALEHSFTRPLLLSLDILDEYCNTACAVDHFPLVHSKLDALFEHCEAGQRFRQSIVEYCGVSNFQVLSEKVEDVVATMVWTPAAAPLFALGELVSEVQVMDHGFTTRTFS